mgnify:CR=1 FL=1
MSSFVKADLDKISELVNFLCSKSQELDSILSGMISNVESIDGAWSGVDSSNFVINACNYLNNLKLVENYMVDIASNIGSINSKYNAAISSFYS